VAGGDDWLSADFAAELRSQSTLVEPEPAPAPPPQPDSNGQVAIATDEGEYIFDDVDGGTLSDRVTRIKDTIGIVDAYERWCGKMHPKQGQKYESIMLSCPMPNHRDEHPSAWANSMKDTWNCGTCTTGGDQIDLFAVTHDYDLPGYRQNKESFKDVLTAIELDLGLKQRGHLRVVAPPAYDPADVGPERLPQDAAVHVLDVRPDPVYTAADAMIDWEAIIPAGTFLHEWMTAYSGRTDSPDEYYFWLGLQALAFSAGWHKMFEEATRFSKTGLFVCLLGDTSTGKSTAAMHLRDMLAAVMPWDPDTASGVKHVRTASAEALITQLFHDLPIDPIGDPEGPRTPVGIKAWMFEDEMANFINKCQRRGGANMEPTVQGLYDFTKARPEIQQVPVGDFSLTSGEKKCFDTFLQATMLTQPGAVAALLSNYQVMSGFMNRWVFAAGEPRQSPTSMRRRGAVLPDPQVAYDLLDNTLHWVVMSAGIHYDVDDEAFEYFDDQFHHGYLHELMHGDKSEMQGKMTARADLLVKKLITLFAVNEHVDGDQVNLDLVQRAFTLLKPWSVGQYLVYHDIGVEYLDKVYEAFIAAWIDFVKTTQKLPTLAQLRNKVNHRQPVSQLQWSQFLNAIRTSGDLGDVEVKISGRGQGRREHRVYLTSHSHWIDFGTGNVDHDAAQD
jgi:hypothetical protein